MTGTSLDALDVAIVRIEGHGLGMSATFLRGLTHPLDSVRDDLRALAHQEPMTSGRIAKLVRNFSLLHADAVSELIALSGGIKPNLVCVHGQTVFHQPPVSWQLFEPWPLAHKLGVPVVCNLRQADLASAGQGAPITPLADVVLYGRPDQSLCVVNLGGFINFTCIPQSRFELSNAEDHAAANTIADSREDSLLSMRRKQAIGVRGGDVCASNQLLDGVARIMLRTLYDKDGAAASTGQVHDESLEDLEGVLRTQSHKKRSLGTGDETLEWVSRWRAHIGPNDMARTACEGIAATLADRVKGLGEQHQPDTIILAGGGVFNRALVNAIRASCVASVVTSDSLGIPAAFREAACFAVLGALADDGVPITLPQVTGRGDRRSGKDGVWTYP